MTTQIKCPHCGKFFEPTEAFKHELENKLEKQLQNKYQQQIKTLEQEKEKLNQNKKEEISRIKSQFLKKATLEAEEKIKNQLTDKDKQIDNLKKRAEQAEKEELKIRKQKQQLQENKRKFEIEKQRQLDKEREKIRTKATEEAEQKNSLLLAQERKRNQDAQKQILELQKKLQQGSQQSQGEVLELEIEQILKREFPQDNIEEVKKGQRGADIIQTVIDKRGQKSGIILWESKNAKWQINWIKKLKEDQRQTKADLAILVVNALPETIKNFTYQDGIWILSRQMIIPIAYTLRFDLIRVSHERSLNINANEKQAVLYQYMSSLEFKHRIEAIIEAFSEMQEQLEKEKRFFNTKWAHQEKSIRKVIDHTHGMYGELQAMMGRSLPEIKSLQIAEPN